MFVFWIVSAAPSAARHLFSSLSVAVLVTRNVFIAHSNLESATERP